MKKITSILIFLLIVLSFLIAFYFYPLMPDRMISHWNSIGEANGQMSKAGGLFIIPIMMLIFTIFLVFIPQLDPEKKNIEKIQGTFNWFIVVFDLFLLYLYLLTIFWNLDFRFNMTSALMPAMGLLFYSIGILMEKIERNYTIGIRLPWTIASEAVWNKTHKLGARLFKLVGIITLIGVFIPKYAFWFLFIPLIAVVIYLTIFSYLEFKKINHE